MRLRDRNTLVMMLLLPVGMTAIIGFAFGGESGISTVEFLLVAPEEGGFLADAAAGFLSQHELFDVERASEEEARRAVAAGERSAAVMIPEGLIDSFLSGTPAEARVLRDPASNIKAGIVQSMVEQIVSSVSAGSALGRGVFETLDKDEPLSDSEQLALWGWMFMWMREAWTEPPVSLDATDADTVDFDVHAYFAPGFAVLFLLFTMLTSAKTIHEERESGTYGHRRQDARFLRTRRAPDTHADRARKSVLRHPVGQPPGSHGHHGARHRGRRDVARDAHRRGGPHRQTDRQVGSRS